MANIQSRVQNESQNSLHLLYKKLGETPNECILRFKSNNLEFATVPMTYAGRLDPMAEGLLLVLSGEEINNKDTYLSLPKTYEVEILWGFETDTLDVLGLVNFNPGNSFSTYPSKDTDIFLLENSSSSLRRASLVPSQDTISTNYQKVPYIDDVKNYLKNSVKKFEQSYPAYSSKPVSGKPLFQWAREGKIKEVKIPKHTVEIFNKDFVSRRIISKKELLKNITARVSSVSGDFRQAEILNKWREVLEMDSRNEFVVDRVSLVVSSGFYVRQFVFDLAKNLNTQAITFYIKRTHIGNFRI